MRIAAAIALAVSMAPAAHADTIIGAAFSGTVDDGTYIQAPIDAPYTPGETINGSFVFDETTNTVVTFNIGSFGVPSGATVLAPAPTPTDSYFVEIAEQNYDSMGNPSATIALEFEFDSPAVVSSIGAFLAAPGAWNTTAIDPLAPSFFSYSDNTGVYFDATLNSFALVAPESVPVPAGLALIAPGLIGLGALRRRAR